MTNQASGRNALVFLFLLVCLVVPASYLYLSSINLPWSDEWNFLPFIERAGREGLRRQDLFDNYNGHNYLVLRLLFLVSATYDHFNLVHVRYLSLAVLCLMSLQILRLVRDSAPHLRVVSLAALALITSLRQWESLGWSMLVVQYLTLSCLLAMLAWYREGRYAGAVWMALLLPFLTGNGVLALAAFAAVLLLKPAARLLPAGLVAVLPRLAVGVLLLVLLAMAVVWGRPREVCLYALQMFGGAFIGDRNSSGLLTVLGALNAGLHGYALYRLLGAWRDGNAGRGPLSLMALILFSVMNVYAAIYSRLLVGGIYQPDASRYALFTLLGTVASIIVLSQTVNSGKVMAAIGVFILLVVGAEDVRMLRMAPHQKVFQCNSYRYLSGERPQKEGMAATGLPPHLQQPALDGVAIMRRNKLGFFSEPPRCG